MYEKVVRRKLQVLQYPEWRDVNLSGTADCHPTQRHVDGISHMFHA
jgi:hypothetical protein